MKETERRLLDGGCDVPPGPCLVLRFVRNDMPVNALACLCAICADLLLFAPIAAATPARIFMGALPGVGANRRGAAPRGRACHTQGGMIFRNEITSSSVSTRDGALAMRCLGASSPDACAACAPHHMFSVSRLKRLPDRPFGCRGPASRWQARRPDTEASRRCPWPQRCVA